MRFSKLALVLFAIAQFPLPVHAGDIIWGGGDGDWTLSPNWIHEGDSGLTAQQVFNRRNGLEVASGELGTDVYIFGSNVTYDPNVNGDFRYRARSGNEAGTLNLLQGTVFSMSTTDGTVDGYWTQWDGKALNIDNSTFHRGANHGNDSTGGALIFGSWRSYADQAITVTLQNGGRLENDGQIWVGTPGDNAPGLNVNFTINNGHLDLTGGDDYELENDGVLNVTADLTFIYGFNASTGERKNETYALNFFGPGTITVDEGGIFVADETSAGVYTATSTTRQSYVNLWNRGILQAAGQSGLTEANFSDYFTVSGTPGQANYRLTSLLPAGDFNEDGQYNVTDLDELMGAIISGSEGATYDVNGDGAVDIDDLDPWLSNAGGRNLGQGLTYLVGDANLSGVVDENDLAVISANLYSQTGNWSAGNFDAAGGVDGTDFNAWNNNKFRSSFAEGAAVPEPANMAGIALLVASAGLARLRRKAC